LKQEWAARGEAGSILLSTARTVYVQLQFRPEYQRPTALQDLRFRRALAHGIDKQAIVDAVLDGEPGMADALVAKEEEYYPELDRALTKYPLDLRRTEQLLTEMGYTKDAEGYFGQGGTRLSVSLTPLGDYLREALILVDGWKRAGIDVPLQTLSPAEQTDQRIATIFPTLIITQFGINPNPVFPFIAATISSEATRWAGRNKGGYFDPDMERFYNLYSTSLERKDRNQAVIGGMKLISDQAAYFPLYYAYEVMAHAGSLVGPLTARRSSSMWKVESWHWR
jgi:peptide/nickel transport system substrate-binding protein